MRKLLIPHVNRAAAAICNPPMWWENALDVHCQAPCFQVQKSFCKDNEDEFSLCWSVCLVGDFWVPAYSNKCLRSRSLEAEINTGMKAQRIDWGRRRAWGTRDNAGEEPSKDKILAGARFHLTSPPPPPAVRGGDLELGVYHSVDPNWRPGGCLVFSCVSESWLWDAWVRAVKRALLLLGVVL